MPSVLQFVSATSGTSLAFTKPIRERSILALWMSGAAVVATVSDGTNPAWTRCNVPYQGSNSQFMNLWVMPRSAAIAAAPTVTWGQTAAEVVIAEIAVLPHQRSTIFDPRALGNQTNASVGGPSTVNSGTIAFAGATGIAIGYIDSNFGTVPTLTSPWLTITSFNNNEQLTAAVLDISAAGNVSLTSTDNQSNWNAFITAVNLVPLATTRSGMGSRAWPKRWPRVSE